MFWSTGQGLNNRVLLLLQSGLLQLTLASRSARRPGRPFRDALPQKQQARTPVPNRSPPTEWHCCWWSLATTRKNSQGGVIQKEGSRLSSQKSFFFFVSSPSVCVSRTLLLFLCSDVGQWVRAVSFASFHYHFNQIKVILQLSQMSCKHPGSRKSN